MGLSLTIVRHGNTFAPGEPARRIGARTDLHLVESGREQARALGARFAASGTHFDHVLASPLARTQETAALILDALPGAPAARIADFLAEIDHGPDEDRPEDAVLARIGATALAAWDERAEPPPGWVIDRDARLADWRDLIRSHRSADASILLVTSNGAARFVFAADPALAIAAASLPSLKLRTGAWGLLHFRADEAEIAAWDRRP